MIRLHHQETKRVYYGWWIVGATATIYGLIGGLNFSGLSLYFLPLAREFNVSRTNISIVFSARGILETLGAPIGGLAVDKIGSRWMVAGGMLLGGLGFILLAITHTYTQLIVTLISLVSLGSSLPDHGGSASINLWFRRHLGLAVSIASSGLAIGGFVLTPLIAWLVLGFDWRVASFVSGLIMVLIGLPVSGLYRNPRADETTVEDREEINQAEPTTQDNLSSRSSDGDRSLSRVVDFTVKQAIITKTFWLLGLAMGLRASAQQTLMVHIVPILVSKRIPESIAAALVSVVALSRLPTSIGAGFLSDRWSRQRTSAVCYLIGATATSILLFTSGGLVAGMGFAILFGSAHAANHIGSAMVGQFFGRKHYGALRGVISLLWIVSMLGPILSGWSFDQTGSYTTTLAATTIAYLSSTIIFWWLKEPNTMEPTR